MFGRQITMKLKANSAKELTRINENEIIPLLRKHKGFRDETTFIAPERSEAIANSFWDSKEDADAYSRRPCGSVKDTLKCARRNDDDQDIRVCQFRRTAPVKTV